MGAATGANPSAIYTRPAEILQHLLRFDTTNPPGNEGACISYIKALLNESGIETTIVALDPERPNLIARLPGEGRARPFMMYGHVDVVTTAHQKWSHAPFGGEIAGGAIWGRGAMDMKGGIAMMIAAFLRAKAEGTRLPGDVILAVLSDEEHGSNFGARFLVEQHADLFKGVHYAIGEMGGFTLHIGAKRFYPIMVAEKQVCWMEATFGGQGGHASVPVRGGAMGKLGNFLHRLDSERLPVHITPVARAMFRRLAANLPFPQNAMIRGLLNPRLTDRLLDLLGAQAALFDPLLHNTASPTIVSGGEKINVIPSLISLQLDGRLLPGFTPDDMIRELRPLAGPDAEFKVIRFDPGALRPDIGLFKVLAGVLREADPEGIPMPLLLSGITDGRLFQRLGIQTYGFLPMKLPAGTNFASTIHAADERIPVDSVAFGADAMFKVMQRFGRD